MTEIMQQERAVWSLATLASARGLSHRMMSQLWEREDMPKPVRQQGGVDMYDADELVAFVERARPGLKR